jgi:predicted transcriptional regulator of viral defense system
MSSQLSWKIIKQFSTKNQFGFTLKDVSTEFPARNPAFLARILAGMVAEGMLYKIARDHYHIIPFNAEPETYVPDGLQVAKYIMLHEEYYIGYASAMKVHGLISQAGEKEYVVTKKQRKPATRIFGEITCQFIRHDTTRFFGFTDMWITQDEQAMVSDLEKTIVDAATKPQFSGGIIEVGNALIRAKDRTDHDKLFYCFARNMYKSAKKRFLFLTELLDLEWTAEHDRMMKGLGSGITLLDPSAPNKGKKSSKFGLKINVDPTSIKKKVLG